MFTITYLYKLEQTTVNTAPWKSCKYLSQNGCRNQNVANLTETASRKDELPCSVIRSVFHDLPGSVSAPKVGDILVLILLPAVQLLLLVRDMQFSPEPDLGTSLIPAT